MGGNSEDAMPLTHLQVGGVLGQNWKDWSDARVEHKHAPLQLPNSLLPSAPKTWEPIEFLSYSSGTSRRHPRIAHFDAGGGVMMISCAFYAGGVGGGVLFVCYDDVLVGSSGVRCILPDRFNLGVQASLEYLG